MKKYLIILLALFLFSCGTRKREKKETKQVTKIDSVAKDSRKTSY
jgi:hypothetical protein